MPFLKGQLHAHTAGSMDSDAPVEVVVRWYAKRGYDFLVLTDHNRITRVDSPLVQAPPRHAQPASAELPASTDPGARRADAPSMMVLPGVELTINRPTCEPPPPPFKHCLLHMNALLPERALLSEPWSPPGRSVRRDELFAQELDEAQRLGAVAMLDHPNFHFAAGVDTITALAARGLTLLEIANEARDSQNEGDRTHPSTEELWDAALTRGARVFGTATDDAHDYFDDDAEAARWPDAYTGERGWVMVRAEPTVSAIRSALARGDFYATNGLLLTRVDQTPESVTIEAATDRAVWFEAIGANGHILRAEAGRTLTFDPRPFGSPYVRVRITASTGRRAWTQPVFLSPSK